MRLWQSWPWFFFLLASSCSIVVLLLWNVSIETQMPSIYLMALLVLAWLGLFCSDYWGLTSNKKPPKSSGAHQQFLQHCRQLDAWRYGTHLHADVSCRLYQQGSRRVLMYLHPHANTVVDIALLRQLVMLMCRYDCQQLCLCSYAGLSSSARNIAEQMQLEVIDHRQIF